MEPVVDQLSFAAAKDVSYPLPVYAVLRAETPPALDGWLESDSWRGAHWIETFLSVETAQPADKPTAVALLWDDQYLYVGFKCREPRLGYLHANAVEAHEVWLDDAVEIYLKSVVPGIESVDTAVNTIGMVCPAFKVISDPGWGTYQFQTPGGVRAAIRCTGDGWQAEIAFPFGEQQLPTPRAGDLWRGNLCRNDRLGFTWSYWALGQSPGYTYSDDKLFPFLRFSTDAATPPPPRVHRPARPRKARFALRGMMYDTSRGSLIYTPQYWIDKLPLLREFDYNAVIMYFENHLRYPSHPAFAPEGSWTLDELHLLQDAAAHYGIDIIPAQTSLGHCPGILTHPKYAELAEEGSDSYQFCPAHPGTMPMLTDIFNDLCAASQSPYVSINADESAYLGFCPRCREEYAGWTKGQIFRQHILKLYEVIQAHGKRMMMWDDMLWLYPEAVEGLPRDIILLDWHYSLHRRYPSVDVWRACGFDVVACPGMYWVDNAFWLADYGAERGAMGMINTLWEDHSLPLGSRWQHLLATSWAAHAPAPDNLDTWFADAGMQLFGPAGARLGHSLAAQDNVKRNGYGNTVPSSLEVAIARQIREEAEKLLNDSSVPEATRGLLEEFVYAQRLLTLQAEATRWQAGSEHNPTERHRILAQAEILRAEGLARWQRQCTVVSQQPAFFERYTAIEKALGAGNSVGAPASRPMPLK